MSVRVGLLTLNAGGQKLCESETGAQLLASMMQTWSPAILVIAMQEYKGGWLSRSLVNCVAQSVAQRFGYQTVASEYASGFGLAEGFRGLALTVLARADARPNVQVVPPVRRTSFPCRGFHSLTHSKGAQAIEIVYQQTVDLLFINSHLPFEPGSVQTGQGLSVRNDCLNKVVERISRDRQPTVTFLLGDLNYRATSPVKPTSTAFDVHALRQSDQLHAALVEHRQLPRLTYFQEANESGPPFAPTCKLRLQRHADDPTCATATPDLGCFALGKWPQSPRQPSWCDRILFSAGSYEQNQHVTTLAYERVDLPALNGTDHAAVLAVFELPVEHRLPSTPLATPGPQPTYLAEQVLAGVQPTRPYAAAERPSWFVTPTH